MKYVVVALLAILLLGLASAAFAADIVSVPTANLVKAGEADVAAYYFFLDFPEGAPQFARVQTLYVGLTDRLEIDAHRYDLDAPEFLGPTDTLWIINYKVIKESATMPDVVVGAKDIADRDPSLLIPHETSYYICTAKTLNPPKPGCAPKFPIVRLHLSWGTDDPTLLGEDRHDGIFGGVQMLVTPKVGVVVMNDSTDWITGVTYTPTPKWPTFKAGTFGDHTWVGMNYTFNMK